MFPQTFSTISRTMNKTQFYLSECAQAASKSPMCFKLGAVLVKGGKVISSGHNHHRPHYDGSEVHQHGHRKPVSMHAEMHAIFSLTGMSPSFKKQVQGIERRVPHRTETWRTPKQAASKAQKQRASSSIPKGGVAPERRLSGAWSNEQNFEAEEREETIEAALEQLFTDVPKRHEQQWGTQRERELWQGNSTSTSLVY